MKTKVKFDKSDAAKQQYSKAWLTKWQYFCMLWISVYLISDIVCNGAVNSVEVVKMLVASIVAVVIPYFAKSFLETYHEKKNRLKEIRPDTTEMEESVDELGNQ